MLRRQLFRDAHEAGRKKALKHGRGVSSGDGEVNGEIIVWMELPRGREKRKKIKPWEITNFLRQEVEKREKL